MSTIPTSVRAKFRVDKIIDHGGTTEIVASAVYSDKGENKDFTDASPSGDFAITIWEDRPAADFFWVGQHLYLDISEAPPE